MSLNRVVSQRIRAAQFRTHSPAHSRSTGRVGNRLLRINHNDYALFLPTWFLEVEAA
jgi:hypothetical protein